MLFNSYPFLLAFLPLTLIGFFALGRVSMRAAATWLGLASLVFYGWWDVRFLPILATSIIWNFASGVAIYQARAAQRTGLARTILILAITANLLALGYFKYVNFFLGIATSSMGQSFQPMDVILPLGISFFTFTQIAFLVDTARGEAREPDFINYVLFVTYFPHLIAGPLLHHKQMMPQFANPAIYRPDLANFAMGTAFFVMGLIKKCVFADSFSPDAGPAFAAARAGEVGALLAWKGSIAYALQLYFDFSGYVDMAIGISLFFGIRLPLNFNSPYRATSIIDFWRRWHITLSTFLRDYLYIPLGGGRHGATRRYANLFITMLLGGLWHGASWTFVVWGALHGSFLMANHAWRAFKPVALITRVPWGLRIFVATALTFLAVVVAWVFFRAHDLPTALRMLRGMAGLNGAGVMPVPALSDIDLFLMMAKANWLGPYANDVVLYVTGLLVVFFLPNSQQLVWGMMPVTDKASELPVIPLRWSPHPAWAVLLALGCGFCLMLFTGTSEFLYFQF